MVKRLKITLMSILAFVMMFTVAFGITSLSSKTKTAYALSGSGTAESPYLISTKADLETFRNKVNAGETSANAQLTADINLENSAWTPIGTGSNKYSGTFDGNDFTVSGLYINSTSSQQGFFGKIGAATIKNLTLRGSVTSNTLNVGGIVGYVNGSATIKNCVNEANVTGEREVGGIVGTIDSSSATVTIELCANKGTIRGTRTSYTYAGGIVGVTSYSSKVIIKRSYNTGNVTTNGHSAAGIMGNHQRGTLEISNVYNVGAITGVSYAVGGIANVSTENNSVLTNCHNQGKITVSSPYEYGNWGAILGYDPFNKITVSNAYYLSGTSDKAGGGTVRSAEQMKTQSSFSGFNFDTVWQLTNGAYPTLQPDKATAPTINSVSGAELNYGEVGGPSVSVNTPSGHTLTYQWYENTTESNEGGTLIEGATSATYNIPTDTGIGEYYYYCVVTSHIGKLFAETTSDVATVVVNKTLIDNFSVNMPSWVYGETPSDPSVNLPFDAPIIYEYKLIDADDSTYTTEKPSAEGRYTVRATLEETDNYYGATATADFTVKVLYTEVKKEQTTLNPTVDNLNEELATSLLTEEENERYEMGESLRVYLEVKSESGAVSIPVADKSAAKSAVTSAGAKEGAYLDLSLFKKIGDDDATAIHESETVFDVTVDIPSDLLEPYGYTRTYSIIRVHDGVAETLPSTVANGKISFSTDKFSTYLIAYSDEYDEDGEYIEFTTSFDGDDTIYTNDIVADTTTVVVNYKITHNDGFNSILLIPQFNTNVFVIDSVSVNETALGVATMTDGDGVMKIVIEDTGDKYEALDGENEFFLTVTYKFIAAVPGEYDFSLVLSSTEENGKSEAFYIAEVGEQKGEQNRVAIRVISNVLTVYENAYIVIGYNDSDIPSYIFVFNNANATVEQVEELGETTNLIAQYTFNGTATTIIKWYDSEMVEMEDAPIHAGTYYLGISAPQDGIYGPVAEVLRLVVINPKAITITADDNGHTYGNTPAELTPVTAGLDNEIEVTFTVKDGDDVIELSSLTNVGSYAIVPSASHHNYIITLNNGTYTVSARAITITAEDKGHVYGDEPAVLAPATAGLNNEIAVSFTVKDGDDVIELSSATNVGSYTIIPYAADPNYIITLENGTYTITKKALTVTADNQNAEYTGSEPTVDQTAYTVSIEGLEISGVIITKEAGVDVGDYELVIAYANDNYEITLVPGTFTITTAAADVEEIKAYFSALVEVYNGAVQDLLSVEELPEYVVNYSATNNLKKNVGTYDISVTVYADGNHNFGGLDYCVFVVEDGEITPAPLTVTANDVNVYFGQEPVVPNFTIEGEVFAGDQLDISYVIEDEEEEFTPSASTPVGVYDIIVSAELANYDITLVDGNYNVLKATPLDEDENGEPDDITTDNENANGLKISFAAEDVYYNRDLIHNETVKVGTVTLDENSYIVTFYSDSACTTEVTPVNAGTYYAKITVLDTDNYDGGSKVVSFEIMRVKLEGVEFSYSHGNATWTAVANDIGKTADETGVAAKELKDGTTVTYNVYNGETLIGTYNTREFAALAATTYKVIAEADDDNYIASESVMLPAYEVSFDEGNHDENPDGDVSDMPDAQYIFENETAIEPDTDPSVDGCTFMNWSLNDVEYLFNEAVTGNITIVAIWNGLPYTITIKYLDSSETLNTDMFVLELFYGDTVDYSELGIAPVKSSDNAGIYYTFANKWVDAENNEYDAVNGTISGFIVTEDMTFVAVFDTNYNSFIITYYFFNNVTDEYDQFGDTQEVIYNQVIDYRTFDGENYAWFIQDYWYGNEARTAAVPAKMPAEDISVYGAYKFDIGQGDVNADGNISSDDITLYRQWIVGGYEMTVVESGTEWALVTGGDYDANVRYFLKRVADNNIDESKDIRDVSITRMAIVGGYDWDISIGETVTGQNIDRTKTATTIANIVNGLTEYGRTRMYVNLTDTTADIEFNVSGNLYLDLGGKTLTVKSFVLNTIGKNATITVKNGTIMTVDGITITAPNGNVILQDLTGYIGDAQVNLQAADSSLHFAGVVEFYANENEEFVPAVINVEEGTHIVIEQAAELTIEKIVVTENFEAAPSAAVTLDNKTSNDVVIEGAIENNISSLSELIAAMNNGGSYILGEDIAYTGTLVFEKDTSINLNGYTLRSTNSNAMYVTDGATLTVSGNGNVIAQEFAAVAFDKSTLIINGGTYTTYDNAVFGTNGTSGRGENTIIINGGTFNGGIQSAGYVACGIYVANNDTVTVNAGTFNVTNGVGILARSGNTTVSGDVVFNVSGDGTLGKVGDSKVTVPAGEVFVVDYAANYPGGDPTFTKNGEYKVCYILGGINNSLSPERADAVIGEALPGSTVILLNDIDYSTTYTVRNARDYGNGHVVDLKDLTLDLNGHTIKTINATVVFSGNGATIKNGTFDLVEKDTDGSYKDGSYALIIDNSVASYGKEGTVTVKDVTVDGGVNVCSATVTLDNVTAHTTTTKFYTVWAETNATITINGGTYTDEQAKGKGIFATGKNAEGGAKIYVNGGTYTGVNKLVYSAEDGAIVITGGTFNLDPSDCVDIANYEVTENDGIYTIVKK